MKILINGRAGAGKDSVADYLVDKYNFKKLAFATGIYEIAYKYFNMQEKNRQLLQDIGQKLREINRNIWANYTYAQVNDLDNFVISDVRQDNEYLIGVSKGFIPVKVNADLDKRIERLTKRDGFPPDANLFEHKAEIGADNFFYFELDNNRDIKDLYKQIDNFMERFNATT